MSEHVQVSYGDSAEDTAVLLLAAAEALDLDPSVVTVSPADGAFVAPEEVVKKAGLKEAKERKTDQPVDAGDNPEQIAKLAESEPQTSPSDPDDQPTDPGTNPDDVQKSVDASREETPPAKEAPAKKTAAKKTAAKKTTPAKKTAAKKSTARKAQG